MCKVFVLTNGSRVKNTKLLVNRMMLEITKHDDDGFGWAAWGQHGAFGERMTTMHGYRRDRNHLKAELPIVKETYNEFGRETAITGAMLFHGRTSTNHKTLINTHPITRDKWTLIHNGVVTNLGEDYPAITTNDSEHLAWYMAKEGIGGVEKNLSGYYAFAALDPNGVLHVAKDDMAPLHIAWIKSIDSFAIATTAALIQNICSQMKWKRGPIDAVEDNVYCTFVGNEMTSKQDITPMGWGYGEGRYMSKSLGRSWGDYDYHGDYSSSAYDNWRTAQTTPSERDDSGKSCVITLPGNTSSATVTETPKQESLTYVTEADAYTLAVERVKKPGHRIYSYDGLELTYDEFLSLDTTSQLDCYVHLPKGDEVFFSDIVDDIQRKAS